MEKAVELLDQCRMEIDSESSIAFDPSNENQLFELSKICALFHINQKIKFINKTKFKNFKMYCAELSEAHNIKEFLEKIKNFN